MKLRFDTREVDLFHEVFIRTGEDVFELPPGTVQLVNEVKIRLEERGYYLETDGVYPLFVVDREGEIVFNNSGFSSVEEVKAAFKDEELLKLLEEMNEGMFILGPSGWVRKEE